MLPYPILIHFPYFLKGIKVKRTDLIGLIMRRNELATEILKASMSESFPPMLQVEMETCNWFICEKSIYILLFFQSPSTCNRCRHLISCTIYHKVWVFSLFFWYMIIFFYGTLGSFYLLRRNYIITQNVHVPIGTRRQWYN